MPKSKQRTRSESDSDADAPRRVKFRNEPEYQREASSRPRSSPPPQVFIPPDQEVEVKKEYKVSFEFYYVADDRSWLFMRLMRINFQLLTLIRGKGRYMCWRILKILGDGILLLYVRQADRL